MFNGTGAIATSATDRTFDSPTASRTALVRAANGSMSSTGAGSDDNDQARTPSEDDVSEMAVAGCSHGGPEAKSPSTGALELTRTRATSATEANADSHGRTRSADDISVRAATGVTTLTQQAQPGRDARSKVPRPDPAADPRWEAAIRARGVGTPIIREDPGTGALDSASERKVIGLSE